MHPVLVFGSLNLDYVYQMDDFVRPKETRAALSQSVVAGGKGLNQSIACARAGAHVSHAGCIGTDGVMLKQLLKDNEVDVSNIVTVDSLQGNAVIQVASSGENCIILYGGSNQCVCETQVQELFSTLDENCILVVQNEISSMDTILSCAHKRGIDVVFNPAPMSHEVLSWDLSAVLWLVVNEVEVEQLTSEQDPTRAWNYIHTHYPKMNLVVTLGDQGAYAFTTDEQVFQPAFSVDVVDTTAAGDTFLGYFVAAYAQGKSLASCMQEAAMAAALAVTGQGAAPSIPVRETVEQALLKYQ